MAGDTTDTGTGTEATTNTAPTDATAADASTQTTDTTTVDDDSTVLGGEGKPEGGAAAPAVAAPEKYELTAPEGLTLDPESIELATPVFQKLGLSNEQAQELMPVAADFANRAGAAAIAAHQIEQAKSFSALTREWGENAKGDAEIGGAKWDQTVELAGKGLDLLGFPKGSEFRKALNESGFGNHPEFIRAFRRAGERLSEDTFERGGGDLAKPKSDRELFYPDYTPKS